MRKNGRFAVYELRLAPAIGALALLLLGGASSSARAQTVGGMQALLQALHQQDFDGGQLEGYSSPRPAEMLERLSPAIVQQLAAASATAAANPRDANAFSLRGVLALQAAHQSLYRIYWLHFAARDLEHALRLDPRDFYAHHNYAEVCFETGDVSPAMPVEHLAVTHFTEAIALNPRSARSYMGRGWAYLMIGDERRANADFAAALRLDPALRPELVKEADGVLQSRRQRRCADAMLKRMGAYIVKHDAHTRDQCNSARGYWTGSECRISTAMAPGPLLLGPRDSATGNAGIADLAAAGNCAPPPDAPDYRYSPRAGGYIVR